MSEEKEVYFQNPDFPPPFAIALFSCYMRHLADTSLKRVGESLSKAMRSNGSWSGGGGIPYAFLELVLQELNGLDYSPGFKRGFVEMREKLSPSTPDQDALRKKVGLIFLEGVIHPSLKEKIPSGIPRKEAAIQQIMQGLHGLLKDASVSFPDSSSSQV
ncbi:MAG: hypothetical protein V4492_06545, partial [Chlamydiota bacterium]